MGAGRLRRGGRRGVRADPLHLRGAQQLPAHQALGQIRAPGPRKAGGELQPVVGSRVRAAGRAPPRGLRGERHPGHPAAHQGGHDREQGVESDQRASAPGDPQYGGLDGYQQKGLRRSPQGGPHRQQAHGLPWPLGWRLDQPACGGDRPRGAQRALERESVLLPAHVFDAPYSVGGAALPARGRRGDGHQARQGARHDLQAIRPAHGPVRPGEYRLAGLVPVPRVRFHRSHLRLGAQVHDRRAARGGPHLYRRRHAQQDLHRAGPGLRAAVHHQLDDPAHEPHDDALLDPGRGRLRRNHAQALRAGNEEVGPPRVQPRRRAVRGAHEELVPVEVAGADAGEW
mmetsp:Transcript_7213/g.17678  ORF Transcript_7213/g.17678 Transcript_7213/m.17678 type:complete len:342 (+) Transcript_7213:386-1411(+)